MKAMLPVLAIILVLALISFLLIGNGTQGTHDQGMEYIIVGTIGVPLFVIFFIYGLVQDYRDNQKKK